MKVIDRLYQAVEEKGFVCVGLDTALEYIPQWFAEKYDSVSEKLFAFNKAIIDATKDITAVYKVQIAYYEANGLEGMKAYKETLAYLREEGLLSIADVKRGDIAATAKMYARAHFEGDFEADFMTLSPYMGFDSITPYMDKVNSGEKGVFVLLRTSNPGAKDIEYLDYQGEPLYYYIGDKLQEMGEEAKGECGYSALGMVVGGTHSEEAIEIRNRYKNTFFLIPGYGAQGAKPEDIRNYMNDFNGGIVNSSRGILKAYEKVEGGAERFWECSRDAVLAMRRDIYGE